MENWLNERREGCKKVESCENIGLYRETLEEWFKFENNRPKDFENEKYDLFNEFYLKSDEVTMNLILESIEEGKNKSKTAKFADISIEELDMYHKVGKMLKNMDNIEDILEKVDATEDEELEHEITLFKYIIDNKEPYIDFYKKYDEIYLPKRLEEFLHYSEEKGDISKAIKNSELSLEEIEYMYECGKEGDEYYEDFYESLLDIKLRIYASAISSNKKDKKRIKTLNLSDEELEENSYQIEALTLLNNMAAVLNASHSKKLDKIAKKFSFDIDDVFEWYRKGKDLMTEYDEEYLEIEEIAPEGKINFFVYLIEDEDYRTNYDEDFDSYYMRFYNVYNEIHVKPKSKILSRNYTNDRDFLRFMLKDLKVTKQEYTFWDSLGLIKNEREMDLDIEDGEEELSKEKVKYKIRRG